ncbi:uncharacterized protein C8A04DRAFT_26125 [Dichotomopilus funicola]|uniref:Uncharacterized protein n=1 Tax=Dichotomopilus funicola TaxID=1934379 RepID=A0AAN6V704_9PEZI|nr:hypothetical protein C8A04DRAFT_26125 [Dichotomopilus funicola]
MAPTETFTIVAQPGTDIWRKPPSTDVFNAPTALPPSTPQPLRHTGPLTSFLSARISLNFTPLEQYDQGGILLSLRRRSDNNPSAPPPKWIKSGIEFYNNYPRVSTVSCDRWADWSVADLVPGSSSADSVSSTGKGKETGWTTIQIEKDKDGNGTGVWVYRIVRVGGCEGEETKVPLREICWVFGEEQLEEWEVEVSAMAARPEKNVSEGGEKELVVEFKGLEVKWAS